MLSQGGPPTQGQYGHPQQDYGGQRLQASPQEVSAYKQALVRAIDEKQLRGFFPPGSPQIDMIASRAPSQVNHFCQQWKVPTEVGRDLARLGLYDIVLFIGNFRPDLHDRLPANIE